ncbi:MAG: BLUF domain-containing protein [Microcoleus sp.]
MYRLLYISTARPAIDAAALQTIMKSALKANRAKGLTGLLVFDGHRFLQYLEGDENEVRGLYAKIKADPRHFAVVTLRESQGEHRQFADWEMALVAGISAAEFDQQVERIARLVENCDILTAAELKGFVAKLAA